jgi:hypothetical protein
LIGAVVGGIIGANITWCNFISIHDDHHWLFMMMDHKKLPYVAATREFKIDEEQIRRFLTEYLYLYHRWDTA